MGRRKFFIGGLILLNLIATQNYSEAALGGTVESVAHDQARFATKAKVVRQRENFSVHEFVAAQTVVREFVTSTGTVFAVAWTGPEHPDLSVLLGNFHEDYVTLASRQKRTYGRRPRIVRSNDLVVQTGGAMFHLRGRAIASAFVPSGVDLNEIK